MRKNLKRIMAMVGAGVMAVSLLAPVPHVLAASTNKVVEVPVNFTNSSWEDDWDSTSNTDACIWEAGEPSAYSEKYTVSYKLYIPVSFIKEDSTVNFGGGLSFNDATEEEWKWAGWSELPSAEMHEDASLTRWDDEQKKDVPIDYATVKKSGDFYVITYEAESGTLQSEEAQSDPTKAEKVDLDFNFAIKGINITAKNSAVYLDDLKITKADGTVLTNQNFTSAKTVEGDYRIAPNKGENDGKALKLATITDNKALTVKSAKATVKVGKTVKISATATPATKITYTSSNKKVATVDSKGVVTGKKAGKATISVKANGKTVKVTVTVKKK
ncbi:MAG: Ig-like domain-containing protein [Firmicutes bacterium]|nr:Ig-like domain-containing protein [Bacillota bacterium]